VQYGILWHAKTRYAVLRNLKIVTSFTYSFLEQKVYVRVPILTKQCLIVLESDPKQQLHHYTIFVFLS